MKCPYYAKTIEQIEIKPGCWKHSKVGIFEGDKQIGEYIRNYHGEMWHPFYKHGKWYALYSKEYTATRVMSLPDCKDLGGEENSAYGFCPVDYFVPWTEYDLLEEGNVRWGFVAGCVWGDDSTWKIQMLDLGNIENGELKRLNCLPGAEYRDGTLEDNVDFDEEEGVWAPQQFRYDIPTETEPDDILPQATDESIDSIDGGD